MTWWEYVVLIVPIWIIAAFGIGSLIGHMIAYASGSYPEPPEQGINNNDETADNWFT
jgi:hypothetical protein